MLDDGTIAVLTDKWNVGRRWTGHVERNLKVKIAVLVLVAAASMAVMGVRLSTMQTELSLDGYASEMRQESDALEGLLASADEGVEQIVTFDEIYQSKAASVAFMANNDAGFGSDPTPRWSSTRTF